MVIMKEKTLRKYKGLNKTALLKTSTFTVLKTFDLILKYARHIIQGHLHLIIGTYFLSL